MATLDRIGTPVQRDAEDTIRGLLFAAAGGVLAHGLQIADACTLPDLIDWIGRKVEASRAAAE